MTKAVDKVNDLKKNKFIEAYKKTNGNITDSAQIVNISRTTYYNWLEEDSDFALAIMDSEANLNDEIRQVLISKAAEGDMTAVIFYLKNRHPDFRQNNQNAQVNVQVNNIISEKKEGYGI